MEMGLSWADVRFFLTQHLQLTLSRTLQRQQLARAAVVPPRDGIFVSIWAHARKGSRGEPGEEVQCTAATSTKALLQMTQFRSLFYANSAVRSTIESPTIRGGYSPLTNLTDVLPSKQPKDTRAHLWRTTPVRITTRRVGSPSSTVITTAGYPSLPSLGVLDGSPLARIAFQPGNCRRSPHRTSQPKYNLPPIIHLQRSKEYDSEKFYA
jgi:hypothetical protein